jgi:hypothetical protein
MTIQLKTHALPGMRRPPELELVPAFKAASSVVIAATHQYHTAHPLQSLVIICT